MQRLTITHVRRWQEHRGYAGLGHVYQGRYKSFPVESDEHFWVVARYVERNALRAISSCERRNGGGQACGNAVILREKSGRCWRRGRSICRRIGSSGSIKPTTRRSWKRCTGACNEAAPLASRNGRSKSRNVWPRVGLSSHGSPAKGGPKSKCLARLKIARTSAGLPSLTISDPSRFPLPVPLSASTLCTLRPATGAARSAAQDAAPIPVSETNSLRFIARFPSRDSRNPQVAAGLLVALFQIERDHEVCA